MIAKNNNIDIGIEVMPSLVPAITFETSQFYTVDGVRPAIGAGAHNTMADVNAHGLLCTVASNMPNCIKADIVKSFIDADIMMSIRTFSSVIWSIVRAFYEKVSIGVFDGEVKLRIGDEINMMINSLAYGIRDQLFNCLMADCSENLQLFIISEINNIGAVVYTDIMDTIRDLIAVHPERYNENSFSLINAFYGQAMGDMTYESSIAVNNISAILPRLVLADSIDDSAPQKELPF